MLLSVHHHPPPTPPPPPPLLPHPPSRLSSPGPQALCDGHGLTNDDAACVVGGWRDLYIRIFGTNLVASPFFETTNHFEGDRIRTLLKTPGSLQPYVATQPCKREVIPTLGEAEYAPNACSFWEPSRDGSGGNSSSSLGEEGGGETNAEAAEVSVFVRGGLQHAVRQHLSCSDDPALHEAVERCRKRRRLCGSSVSSASDGSTEFTTGKRAHITADEAGESSFQYSHAADSHIDPVSVIVVGPGGWSSVFQDVSLKTFGFPFVNSCPALHLSLLCSAYVDPLAVLERAEGKLSDLPGTHGWIAGQKRRLGQGSGQNGKHLARVLCPAKVTAGSVTQTIGDDSGAPPSLNPKPLLPAAASAPVSSPIHSSGSFFASSCSTSDAEGSSTPGSTPEKRAGGRLEGGGTGSSTGRVRIRLRMMDYAKKTIHAW